MKYVSLKGWLVALLFSIGSCVAIETIDVKKTHPLIGNTEILREISDEWIDKAKKEGRNVTKSNPLSKFGNEVQGWIKDLRKERILVEDVDWRFYTTSDSAGYFYAFPDGTMVFSRGFLLVPTSSDVAKLVIAHSMAHILLGHDYERIEQVLMRQFGGMRFDLAYKWNSERAKQVIYEVSGMNSKRPYLRLQEREASQLVLAAVRDTLTYELLWGEVSAANPYWEDYYDHHRYKREKFSY